MSVNHFVLFHPSCCGSDVKDAQNIFLNFVSVDQNCYRLICCKNKLTFEFLIDVRISLLVFTRIKNIRVSQIYEENGVIADFFFTNEA